MQRACKVTLKFATNRKRRAISALLESYRGVVNFYIRSLWGSPGALDKNTLARLTSTRLSERYKSQALKQALEIVNSTKKSVQVLGKVATCPVFSGAAILDGKFVSIENGRGSFDIVIRLSVLNKGHRIIIPSRKTAVLNKWLSYPLAYIIQGCTLTEKNIVLWVEIPATTSKQEGINIGVDIGVNKLVTTSDGKDAVHYGTGFKVIRDKVNRRKAGSKGKKQARCERDNYINQTVNRLPWETIRTITVERLLNLKYGKKKDRGKGFRKAMAPWTYRKVLGRLECKAAENRVRLFAVDPRNTSRQCPTCSLVSKDNRKGENFCCIGCGYKADADFIGATNILACTLATLGSIESPKLQKVMI